MRRLFKVIVGLFAFLGVVAVGGVVLAVWGISSWHSRLEPSLPKRMVMTLDLEQPITDGPGDKNPLALLNGEKTYRLTDVVAALDRAAKDPEVVGLFATMGETRMGMATAQEIRDAVLRFKASGKPAVLFAETMGEAGGGTVGYYMASAFGSVWLQPSGMVSLTGFSAETPFVRGTLDLLGIEPQMAGRKEYKTAIESLTERRYSRANAETLNALLDSWTAQVADGIAQGRHMPQDKARALIGKGPFMAKEAISAGLVDQLGYRDEALKAAHGDGAKATDVDLADYSSHAPKASGPHVALIVGNGAIMRGEQDSPLGDDEAFGAATVAEAFRDAVDDPKVRAILFRVNSPGGSYVASDVVWNEVRRARAAGKPVVVSMGDTAASGGYFVSMAADRIVAQPGTITGSIGVFTGKVVLAEFWSKLGVTWDELHRGDNAGMFSMNRPFTPAQWDRVNVMLDTIYADFTGKAAMGRKMTPAQIEAIARGRVWSGSDAKAVGLVDALGGLDTAMGEVRTLLNLQRGAALHLVAFPEPKAPWRKMAKALAGGHRADQADLRVLARMADVLAPVAARMSDADPRSGALRAPALPRAQ